VGPNGAGKTTLIKILATLLRPTTGSATIAGRDVTREPRATRVVAGYMPDVPGVYSDLQVHEFLEFFAEAFHIHGERKFAAVDRALQFSGLADRRSAYVEHLSLGLKQRLVLAKTLLHDPKVLLLDEPATGLDPLARIELRQQLRHLNQQGVTIFLSSHILADLEDICTRVALIAGGHNAADPEGRSVIELAEIVTTTLICEIETIGSAESAAKAAAQFTGARVLETRPASLRIEVTGGRDQASALLLHLVSNGIRVLRFDPRGPGLEERYRTIFGRKPS
ncbi:MAG: ABC transporter ATP-binding protein, partial [Candidatus Angelobacter sp.]